ncbi:PSD1 and planctomycete cytochrome C domain-containing protein [Bryobacter aggregatus]|uniref:PSD1 and planctomycete cytochrome C domain-containing protein n=1 Tax=Bryobacter aggregatus TaxID=360054 RepID=UPI000A3FCFB3|nr:PSD1 and planctomycete cytochrome C domain-containing protein [Bryobacter aggregatus]
MKFGLILFVFALGAFADEFFEKKIRPVLVERCYGCHSEKVREPKAGLRLDSREGVRRGGDSGPAIVIGKPEESRLLKAISYTDFQLRMPPTGKLPDAVVADFAEWIRRGAEDPRETSFVVPARKPVGSDIERGKKYWAFQPLRPGKLEMPGGKPVSKEVWIRRVSFDLTGLPPTPAAVRAFVADSSPGAYETVVDRLLASPQYGERYGRHWLDLVRYAETNGHEYDNNKLDAYRYRDYVVRAFNEDLPYDQFVKEHVAGDLLPRPRVSRDGAILESPLATGAYWFGEVLNSATDSEKSRADEVDNQIDVMSKAFLGLTVACARCHDHKFDPIPTADYYGLAGILHSTSMREAVVDSPERRAAIQAAHAKIPLRLQAAEKRRIVLRPGDELFDGWDQWQSSGEAFSLGGADSSGRGAEALVGSLTSRKFRMPKRYVHVRMRGTQSDKKLVENNPLRVTLVADEYRSEYFVASGSADFEWVSARMVLPFERMCYFEVVDRSRSGHLEVDAIVISDHKEPPQVVVESPAVASAPVAGAEIPESAFAMVAMDEAPHDVKLHIRGSHQNLGEVVPRHVLQVLSPGDGRVSGPGSGRLELAEWLASPGNALTARVLVNRMWKHHFGKGLVKSTDNFGLTGDRPESREMLDALAAQFLADGWSVKKLNRRIVLSDAYRGELPVRRLEAEAVRDAMLAVSGRFDSQVGGPSVGPYISKYQDGRGKPVSGPLDGDGRRSLYVQVRRNFLSPMMLAFDYPLPVSTIGTRSVSTVPSQALILLNNEFVLQQAEFWGSRIGKVAGDDSLRVRTMFEEAFGRAPLDWELQESLSFLAQGRSLAELGHVLLNSAEFLYVQ